jgi:chemotaxis protein MotB
MQSLALMKTTTISCALAFVLLATSGCVSKGKYDEAVAQTRITQAELDRKTSTLADVNAENARQRAEIANLEALISSLSRSARSDKASSEASIAELKKRLDELRREQIVAEARAALFESVSVRLKKQIDNGDLDVVIRDGRMVVRLPDDVLFDTGKTELKPNGKYALEAVADVMRSLPNRHFQVAGHTDNVPIHNDRFASNWELSSGRALRVVHFLVEKGVDAPMLSAAGYGEVDPVAKNDTPEGKRKNRRTEITLQPNIDEFVKVPRR